MSLIKSISGIRGTIGGKTGDSLSPVDVVMFTAAFGTWILNRHNKPDVRVIVGRDARKSGSIINNLVIITLRSLGINVTDIGMTATPTVELAVTGMHADGGVIITASHNPAEWNALKLLNEKGEFLSDDDGTRVLGIADEKEMIFAGTDGMGSLKFDDTWGLKHINQIMELDLVDTDLIKSAGFTVAIDCINSVGGTIIPQLLKSLGVNKVIELNIVPDGNFAHNPEPLPENLVMLSETVSSGKADVGFAVDPDVDRLAIVCEDGSMFGEEYTLVSIADYVLGHTSGNTVSNLSSSRALKDITQKHGGKYYAAPVGEVNVVHEMKKRGAIIGGEGNGGVIYPRLHYGRDALAGIALFLSWLAKSRMKCSILKRSYPLYVIAKKKIALSPDLDFKIILNKIKDHFIGYQMDERDGLKIEKEDCWVQIRKSNTEPIIRIYAEARTQKEAEELAGTVIGIVKNL